MKNKLYIECFAGISGDMMVASLIDLGANKDKLLSTLESIPVEGYKIEITKVKKSGIDASDFNVILDHDNHDHDMKYLHEHHHEEEHHHHHHEHTNLEKILKIIDNTNITDNAKEIAKNIFDVIADAESIAHGTDKDKVFFHEVGAIDSIVDIIAVAFCIDDLNISDVYVSELYEGFGNINCQHGIIPIPVPAVANILAKYSYNIHITDVEGELVTPTGMAIVAALKAKQELPKNYKIKKIGLGAGKREYKTSGILRTMIIE